MFGVGGGDGEGVGGKVALKGHGDDGGAAVEDGAWLENAVAAGFGVVGEECAEFAQAGVGAAGVGEADGDGLLVEAQIGADDAGTEVAAVAENGIADVVEVWCLDVVEEEAVFKFTTVAEDAAFSGDDFAADVGAGPDFGLRADPGGAFDDGIGRELDGGVQVNGAFQVDACGKRFRAGGEVGSGTGKPLRGFRRGERAGDGWNPFPGRGVERKKGGEGHVVRPVKEVAGSERRGVHGCVGGGLAEAERRVSRRSKKAGKVLPVQAGFSMANHGWRSPRRSWQARMPKLMAMRWSS